MANRLIRRLLGTDKLNDRNSYLRSLVTGSLYRVSDMKIESARSTISTQIKTMRALATDSQIDTALSYYATDATVPNSNGEVIWAVPLDNSATNVQIADVINTLFKKWKVSAYARDHILELATIGNLYIPTSVLFRDYAANGNYYNVALDNNTLVDDNYDVMPVYKLDPEEVVHIYYQGHPQGYIYDRPAEDGGSIRLPENAIVHFALGGLLGDYKFKYTTPDDGVEREYDIKFATPLMEKAVQPTQTLSLFEDALLLSSLSRNIKFISIECGNVSETEVEEHLQQIKDTIEQQLSLNTSTGDAQSFVNPQSPNNLIYLPQINGSSPIAIDDLDMAVTSDNDSYLLDHYQTKKLSVLGVPKEAMNYSSNEGLGGAGSVLSQRSALYANSLARLESAYISGWKDAINMYFEAKGMSGFVDQFELRMQPIITNMSTVEFEQKDSVMSQATQIIDLLKSIGVTDHKVYSNALSIVFGDAFPELASDVNSWSLDVEASEEEMM